MEKEIPYLKDELARQLSALSILRGELHSMEWEKSRFEHHHLLWPTEHREQMLAQLDSDIIGKRKEIELLLDEINRLKQELG